MRLWLVLMLMLRTKISENDISNAGTATLNFLNTPLCEIVNSGDCDMPIPEREWTEFDLPVSVDNYGSLLNFFEKAYQARIQTAQEFIDDPNSSEKVASNLNGANILLSLLQRAGVSSEEILKRSAYIESLQSKLAGIESL